MDNIFVLRCVDSLEFFHCCTYVKETDKNKRSTWAVSNYDLTHDLLIDPILGKKQDGDSYK